MSLNRSVLNGSTLNGTTASAVVLAAATVLCGTSATASGSHVRYAAASVSVFSLLTARAHRFYPVTAALASSARMSAAPKMGFAGFAAPTASIVLYAQGSILYEGEATAACVASLYALPNTELGEGEVSATASATAVGTRVQFALAQSIVATTVEALDSIDRRPTADVGVVTTLIAEASIKLSGNSYFDHDGFATAVCSTAVAADGLNVKVTTTNFSAFATTEAAGTRVQFAEASSPVTTIVVLADSLIFAGSTATAACTTSLAASADRVRLLTATVSSSTAVSAAPSQRHSARAAASSTAFVLGRMFNQWLASATSTTRSTVAASGVRGRLAKADVLVLTYMSKPEGSIRATRVPAQATVSAKATVASLGFRYIYGAATATSFTQLDVDTITNPGSLDIPARTFYRPTLRTDFVRPAQISEFRRAA